MEEPGGTCCRGRRVAAPWRLLLLVAALGAACGGEGTPVPTDDAPDILQAVGSVPAQGLRSAVLPGAPTVRLVDGRGVARAGVAVSFVVTAGGGQVSEEAIRTDAAGAASTLWILGPEPVDQRLEARVGDAVVEFRTRGVPGVAGVPYMGASDYVEYIPGSLPLVLSAGHGGSLRPASIPDRTQGVTTQDRNTIDLAVRVADALESRLGGRPHLVLSHLHRIKLDPNRDLAEAAQGDPAAGRAWWEYHAFLEGARAAVEEGHGEGLYVDVHGHGHAIPRIELGYLLSSAVLELSDAELSSPGPVASSSLRALVVPGGPTLAELVRGSLSLGGRLQDAGVPAVPSPAIPSPGADPYFSGGYSTARHGSRDGGAVSGIQVEAHLEGVRDTPENRERFAGVLADALILFFRDHMGTDPTGR